MFSETEWLPSTVTSYILSFHAKVHLTVTKHVTKLEFILQIEFEAPQTKIQKLPFSLKLGMIIEGFSFMNSSISDDNDTVTF